MCGCNAGGMCECFQKDGKWFFKDGRVHARWERELELEQQIERLRGGKIMAYDWMRLKQWSENPARQPPDVAFTSGVLRDAASAFLEVAIHRDELRDKVNETYWDGIRDENTELRAKVRRLESRGIEDLRHENDQFRKALMKISNLSRGVYEAE